MPPDAERRPEPSALGGCKARGYSSVARAVALQAIGLGFKSPYLQLDVAALVAVGSLMVRV